MRMYEILCIICKATTKNKRVLISGKLGIWWWVEWRHRWTKGSSVH